MKQKKFWQKLIGSTLAILLIVPFSFIKVNAQTLNTNYSLTQYNYYNSLSSGDNPASFICVNFKKPATGTLTITATGIGSVSGSNNVYQVNVISGGNLTKINTNNFTVSLTGSDNVQILVEGNPVVTTATFLTYTMSFSGSYIDNETVSLDNIDANIVTISGKVNDAVTILGQINTKLASLSVQDYTTILNTINSSIGSVETAIGNIPDYTSVLNSINNYLGSIDVNISDIETICSGILSAINNIDTLIDTISWINLQNTLLGFTTDFTNFDSSSNYHGNGYILFPGTSTTNIIHNNMILKMQIAVSSQGINPSIKWCPVMVSNGGTVTNLMDYVLYYQCNRLYTTFYVDLSRIPDFGTYRFGLWMNAGLNRYLYMNQPSYLAYIGDNDIEYWKLRSTMQQWQFYNGNNATNQSITDQSSTNQSFESQSNQYHNLESTFQSNFDTAFNAVNPSDFTTALTQFAPAFAWFTNQLGALYDSSGNFKILFTLPLILGLAMFFLGRGGKVFDHPEHESDKHAYTFSKDTDGTIYPVRKNRSGNNVRNS